MKTFQRRSDPTYQDHLAARLSLDGDLGLRATAETLEKPRVIADQEFTKAINIEFFGCTATTFFDPGQVVAKGRSHLNRLQELGRQLRQLNSEGILVSIRVLLLYPYANAGQIRIQAENSSWRATINQPERDPQRLFIEQVTDHSFASSSLFATSCNSLKVIYEWTRPFPPGQALFQPPNTFQLRFSIFNPIVCGLRLNSCFFYDVYSYAKKHKNSKICSGDTQPVIQLTPDDGLPYSSFCDHFHYLWSFDATLDSEDVVDLSSDNPAIRMPQAIDYRAKVRRLSEKTDRPTLDRLKQRDYRLKAARILRAHCPPVRPTSSEEVAFLACAWRKRGGSEGAPNPDAVELKELWQEYFVAGDIRTVPRIEITLIEGPPGPDLKGMLYRALNGATIGLVVLSPEIAEDGESGRKVCTPNVYHELGYLMASIEQERTFIFLEKEVDAPANIGSKLYVEYVETKISLGFLRLLEGLRDAELLGMQDAEDVALRHLEYLRKGLEAGRLTDLDLRWARQFFDSHLRAGCDGAEDVRGLPAERRGSVHETL